VRACVCVLSGDPQSTNLLNFSIFEITVQNE
jgi:hypothetical protein